MLVDVVEVKVLEGYKLFLRFEDDVQGEVDVSQMVPFKGIFEVLKDLEYFKSVKLNKEVGTIGWENGADLSPCALYEELTS